MWRYVILEHDHPTLHWDFFFEEFTSLRGWRLDAPPEAGQHVGATPGKDHRLMYLDYEGPVSGDRGNVVQWDRGEYKVMSVGPLTGLPTLCVIRVDGRKLRGTVTFAMNGTLKGTLLYEPASVTA